MPSSLFFGSVRAIPKNANICKNRAPRTFTPSAKIKIPHSLEEVDSKLLGFGAELSEDHPGFYDDTYKRRRAAICDLARASPLTKGQIPRVDYTQEEQSVWATVMNEFQLLHQQHACASFLNSYPLFNFTPDTIPQLQDLSDILKRTTGWQIRPTAGLLHPRDFLAGLAFRCFHSTQYIRHHSRPSYTPEPDVIHECLGHVVMLTDPLFCDLVRHIGTASLGADEATIWKLTKIYWFTVEFGVVREGGENSHKAFGAGILSSYGEMKNMASGAAVFDAFDPFAPLPRMSYKDGYQKHYFVLNSFEEGAVRLREYCNHVQTMLPSDVREEVAEVLLSASASE